MNWLFRLQYYGREAQVQERVVFLIEDMQHTYLAKLLLPFIQHRVIAHRISLHANCWACNSMCVWKSRKGSGSCIRPCVCVLFCAFFFLPLSASPFLLLTHFKCAHTHPIRKLSRLIHDIFQGPSALRPPIQKNVTFLFTLYSPSSSLLLSWYLYCAFLKMWSVALSLLLHTVLISFSEREVS